jgi:predicted metal-dependent hydrolase
MRSSKRASRVVEEGLSLQTKHGTISYRLKKSSFRRSMAISINENAAVTVSTPIALNQERMINFIHEKAEWILAKVNEIKITRTTTSKNFLTGGAFLFLGEKYPLQLTERGVERSKIEFDGEKWRVYLPAGLDEQEKERLVRKRLEDWYKKQAREILGGRLFQQTKIVGVAPKIIDIRTQKRVWGNCNFQQERIHLNWQLILAPLEVIDYVIVHELCHLIEPNHSHRFWKCVRKFNPDFERHKKWLKDHHWEIIL